MKTNEQAGFTTRSVHAGRGCAGSTGAVMPPLFVTSTSETDPGAMSVPQYGYTHGLSMNLDRWACNLLLQVQQKVAT